MKNNSKWKYIKELLNRYPDISFTNMSSEKNKIIDKLYLPYAYSYWQLKLRSPSYIDNGSDFSNDNNDDNSESKYLTYEELIEIYSPYFKLPYIQSDNNLIDIQIKKEGKSDVGQEAQLDIQKTIENKIKRLIIEKSDEDVFDNLLKYITEEAFDDKDLIYNTFRIKLITKNIKHVLLAIDVSGSINDRQRLLAKSLFSLIFHFLSKNEDISYLSLFLHEVRAYYKGTHEIKKNANIKEYIKNKQIAEFLKMQSGFSTSLIDLSNLINNKLKEMKTTNYFVYVGDFWVSESDIDYFIDNVLNNKKINYIALVCTGENVNEAKRIYEKMHYKISDKTKVHNYFSFIFTGNLNKSNSDKYIAEDLINISKFISIAGFHEI